MIRKAVRRAAVWTVGAGLVVAPMSVVGPQLSLVACENPGGQYPRGINSQTDMRLDDSVGRYGDSNRATATVTSNQGTPEGRVAFIVNGIEFDRRAVGSDGRASVTLPRGLRGGDTHTLRARFVSDCPWNNSRSPRRYYTVHRANTTTNPGVTDARGARFTSGFSRVGEGEGFNPLGGSARFTVRREGSSKVIRRATATVKDGVASVNMRNLRNGSYTIRSRYLGSHNFRPGQSTESFRVN